MLISFDKLIAKYGIKPKGVIHIGANNGAECKAYYSNGVERTIWIKPKEVEIFIKQLKKLKGK